MLAIKKNLKINRGNDITLNFSFVNQNNQNVIFESDSTLFFTVKESYESSEYIFQKKTSNGITYNSTINKYKIKIDAIDTDNLEFKDYVYDLKILRKSGSSFERKTLVRGDFKIDKSVTSIENEV